MANRKDRTRSTKSIKPPAPYQLRREDPPDEPAPIAEPVLVADPVPVPVAVSAPVPVPVSVSVPAPLPLPLPARDPCRLPAPDEIALDLAAPTDLAPPPGRVPAGDSRSLRRGDDFALVYRHHTHVITRAGSIGTHGRWHVIAYPTPSAASHAYAVLAAHLADDGFTDYTA